MHTTSKMACLTVTLEPDFILLKKFCYLERWLWRISVDLVMYRCFMNTYKCRFGILESIEVKEGQIHPAWLKLQMKKKLTDDVLVIFTVLFIFEVEKGSFLLNNCSCQTSL